MRTFEFFFPLEIFALLPVLYGFFIYRMMISRGCADKDRTGTFLAAALLWAVSVVFLTEFLSALSLISFKAVFTAWLMLCAAAFGLGLKQVPLKAAPGPQAAEKLGAIERCLLAVLALVVLVLGIIAFQAPPNDGDSMAYHMPRVFHWIQNKNLNHYPTNILRQLFNNPGAEYLILHFQILTAGDRFANSVGWLAMIGCLAGISGIVRELGGSRKARILAAIFCVTIPQGILSATSTKNDYAVSFWIVCSVYYLLRLQTGDGGRWLSVKLGMAVGLALLTKGTSYFYLPPFLAWVGLSLFRKDWRKAWKSLGVVLVFAAVINSGFWMRNIALSGSPIGAQGVFLLNQEMTPGLFFSNLLRNMSLHWGTPFEAVNAFLLEGLKSFHGMLGLALDDPRTTCQYRWPLPCSFIRFSFEVEKAGNLIHFVLIGAILILWRRRDNLRRPVYYALSLLAGFLLLNFVIKTSPFSANYQLPLFVLFSPLIAVQAARWRKGAVLISGVLILSALPWIFFANRNLLIGPLNIFNVHRIDLYFTNVPWLIGPYRAVTDYLRKYDLTQIGFVTDEYGVEYPLLMLLKESFPGGFRFEHVKVGNISSRKAKRTPFREFLPQAIVAFAPRAEDKRLFCRGRVYEKGFASKFVSVFKFTGSF